MLTHTIQIGMELITLLWVTKMMVIESILLLETPHSLDPIPMLKDLALRQLLPVKTLISRHQLPPQPSKVAVATPTPSVTTSLARPSEKAPSVKSNWEPMSSLVKR